MGKRAWIENGNIFITEDDTLILQDYIEVPEETTLQDLKIVDGRLVLKTEEEKLEELKQEQLQKLKQYVFSLLFKTDWIVIKCIDLELNIEEAYPDIKRERNLIRAWYEELKNKILQETSISKLKELDLNSDFIQYFEKKKIDLK